MDDHRQSDLNKLEGFSGASIVNELRKEIEHANERLKLYVDKDIETMERVAENETTIEELKHQIITMKDDMLKYDVYGKNWQLEKVKNDYRVLEKICQVRERQFNKARNDLKEQMNRDRQAFNLEKKDMIRGNEELLTRLSKPAGPKLTRNNPGITDLSDRNRVSKIAKQFNELYETEWTDAFEELMESGLKENEVIYVILDIVKTAYGFCCKLAEKYKAGIFEAPSQLPVLGVIRQSDPDMKVNPEIELSDEIRSQLEDIRKALSPLFCESVEKIFLCILRDTLPKSITTAKGGSTDVDMKMNIETPISDELASEKKGVKDNKENTENNKTEGTINSEINMQSTEDGSENNERSASNASMTMDSTTLNKQAKVLQEEKSDNIEDIRDLFKNNHNIGLTEKQINDNDIQGNENMKREEITDLIVGNEESVHLNFKTGNLIRKRH